MPSYNQPNNPTNIPAANPIKNELLRMLNQNQEIMHNALLRRVDLQIEPIPPIAVINPPINSLLSSTTEPKENPLLSSITELH